MSGSDEKRRAALSMDPGLEARMFTPAQWQRLERHLQLSPHRWAGEDVEVLITGWGAAAIGRDDLEGMPSLRAVFHGAGTVKGILGRDMWDRGVLVTTAAAANALPVAEFTLAAILFAGKRVFPTADEYARDPGFDRESDRFGSIGNYDRTIGIVGASQIGRRVIELLRPFDVEVLVSDPFLSAAEADALGVHRVELDELFRRSDVVSIHAPLLESTVGLISAPLLESMPSGATLINTARGGLVDHDALTRLALEGKVSAVLDVTDPEPLPRDHSLRGLPNVFLTPHWAGARGNELHRLGESVVLEVEALAEGRSPLRPLSLKDMEKAA